MNIQNKLYMLHIPKTGVRYVNQIIRPQLKKYNILCYPSTPYEKNTNLNDFHYMHGHFGNYPLSNVTNLSIACIFRDPLERAVSNFVFIYNKILKDRYSNIYNIKDQLTEYLFNDNHYYLHNNIYARFLLSGTDHEIIHISKQNEDIFNNIKTQEEINKIKLEYFERSKIWYLPEVDISFEEAKKNIDKIEILGLFENIENFIYDIWFWFYKNYNVEKSININLINNTFSKLNDFNNKEYKTKDLLSLLSISDIEKYKKNNEIDYKIYNYVKQKLSAL